MKLLVYTCVFKAYDRIFPPVINDSALDYVIITDDPELNVRGWRSKVVDTSPFGGARAANRHYKILGHGYFPEYSGSIYIDGNIRMLGEASRPLRALLESGNALGVFRHPKRGTVAEEMAACIEQAKIDASARPQLELEDYLSDGFSDHTGLVEATILFKNHGHRGLDPAMRLWWSLFERYDSRDQFSLPYVLWKTGLPCYWHDRSFREPNPYFGIYPHLGAKHIPARYTYVAARAYDSLFFRALLGGWHAKWRLQRWLRSMRNDAR